jgi:hypothetical protein
LKCTIAAFNEKHRKCPNDIGEYRNQALKMAMIVSQRADRHRISDENRHNKII